MDRVGVEPRVLDRPLAKLLLLLELFDSNDTLAAAGVDTLPGKWRVMVLGDGTDALSFGVIGCSVLPPDWIKCLPDRDDAVGMVPLLVLLLLLPMVIRSRLADPLRLRRPDNGGLLPLEPAADVVAATAAAGVMEASPKPANPMPLNVVT